jgi:ferritin-like protein
MQNADHITSYYYHRYSLALRAQNLTAATKFYKKARASDRGR